MTGPRERQGRGVTPPGGERQVPRWVRSGREEAKEATVCRGDWGCRQHRKTEDDGFCPGQRMTLVLTQVLLKPGGRFPAGCLKGARSQTGWRSRLGSCRHDGTAAAGGEPLEGERRRSRTAPWEACCVQEPGGRRRAAKEVKGGLEPRGLRSPGAAGR